MKKQSAEVSIPSNRGYVSDNTNSKCMEGKTMSQSPQIGAMFRTEAEIAMWMEYMESQSPQIGAMFRTPQ